MNLEKYFDKHKDKTIFILGNSNELNELTEDQIKDLEENHVTIGVNYSHMKIKSNYMITGHMSHVVYAKEYPNINNTIFFQTYTNNPVFSGLENVETIFCDYGNGDTMKKQPLRVEGCTNISISASHLAYLMGASRVVYLGFNQKNLLHFYDTDIELREKILSNIKNVRNKLNLNQYSPSVQRQKTSILHDYNMHVGHMLPIEELQKRHWTSRPNNVDNIKILTSMFDTMKSNGIEVVSTCEESIMTDSGATYIPIKDILNDK